MSWACDQKGIKKDKAINHIRPIVDCVSVHAKQAKVEHKQRHKVWAKAPIVTFRWCGCVHGVPGQSDVRMLCHSRSRCSGMASNLVDAPQNG